MIEGAFIKFAIFFGADTILCLLFADPLLRILFYSSISRNNFALTHFQHLFVDYLSASEHFSEFFFTSLK